MSKARLMNKDNFDKISISLLFSIGEDESAVQPRYVMVIILNSITLLKIF